MTINFVQLWDIFVKCCAIWLPLVVLLSGGIVIGESGQSIDVSKKVKTADSAFEMFLLIGFPSVIIMGRVFSWW